MPITGIEPWTSCLRGERSTNIATTDYNEHYLTNRFLLSVDQSQDFTNCATTTANEKSLAIGIWRFVQGTRFYKSESLPSVPQCCSWIFHLIYELFNQSYVISMAPDFFCCEENNESADRILICVYQSQDVTNVKAYQLCHNHCSLLVCGLRPKTQGIGWVVAVLGCLRLINALFY